MSSPVAKVIMEKIICAMALIGLADYMLFGNITGTVSPLLSFHEGLHISKKMGYLSLMLAVALLVIVWLCWRYHRVLQIIFGVLAISLFGLGSWNIFGTCQELKEMDYIKSISEDDSALEVSPILTLSKTEKMLLYLYNLCVCRCFWRL